MSTKYYCDRCEAEVQNGPGRFTVKIDRYTGEDELVEDDVVLDYCQRCVSKIEEKVPRMRALKGDLPLGWSKDEETPAEDRTLELEP